MKKADTWLSELVAETSSGLARYVSRFCRSPQDVQDVVQDAYLQVYCALRETGPDGHTPEALVYTTARNLAFSRLRHQRVVAAAAPAVSIGEKLRREQQTVDHQASDRQRLQQLLAAVSGLTPKCRDVFVLRMIEGLSQREIAERLQISVSTVEKHLARGLRQCREAMGEPAQESGDEDIGDERARGCA